MTKGWAPEQDTKGTFIFCIMTLIVIVFFTVFAFCISQIHNNPKPKPEVQIPTEISASVEELKAINARKTELLNKTMDYAKKMKKEASELEKEVKKLENGGKITEVVNNVSDVQIKITKEYHANDQIKWKSYHEEGNKHYWHREDGPAYTWWDENGNKLFEAYWVYGKLHREDGPARIDWDEYGNVMDELYYLNNRNYTKEEYLKKLEEMKNE